MESSMVYSMAYPTEYTTEKSIVYTMEDLTEYTYEQYTMDNSHAYIM